MNILKAFSTGFKTALSMFGMVFFIYLANLLFALVLTIPYYGELQMIGKASMLPKDMMDGFDFMAFSEFMQAGKGVWNYIFSQLIWVSILYFLLNLFITGGILRSLNKHIFTLNSFFSGAAHNFLRFLMLGAFMLLLHFLLLISVFMAVGGIIGSISKTAESEIILFNIGFAGAAFYLFMFFLLLIISDYAKYTLLLRDSKHIFKAFGFAVKFVFKRFFKVYALYLMLIIPFVLVTYILYSISDDLGASTGFGIAIAFVMQQLFILARVWQRVWIFSGQFNYFSPYFLKQETLREAKAQKLLEAEVETDDNSEINSENE